MGQQLKLLAKKGTPAHISALQAFMGQSDKAVTAVYQQAQVKRQQQAARKPAPPPSIETFAVEIAPPTTDNRQTSLF